MKSVHLIFLAVHLVLCVAPTLSQDFDFFFFVQLWPGSYCDTKRACCYPTTGKPEANFSIHGLWPNYNDGSYPQNCDPDSHFDESQVSDLLERMQKKWPTLACPSNNGIKFWSHEWVKHGTCSESILDQHAYFQKALDLQNQVNILKALTDAGIEPSNEEMYSLGDIEDALKEAIGFTPGIQCNKDSAKTSQLYQITFCVDTTASNLIECPVFPRSNCPSRIEFPSF